MPYQEEKTLKEVLLKMLDVYKLRGKLHQTRIRNLWETHMGASVARQTTDIQVRHKKLYVSIESAALRNELSYGREKICRIMNEALGERYLQEVIIR